jgi:hypothetical protein
MFQPTSCLALDEEVTGEQEEVRVQRNPGSLPALKNIFYTDTLII